MSWATNRAIEGEEGGSTEGLAEAEEGGSTEGLAEAEEGGVVRSSKMLMGVEDAILGYPRPLLSKEVVRAYCKAIRAQYWLHRGRYSVKRCEQKMTTC